MGRLIGLNLYNFKSYRGLNRIGFGSANFTSIMGTNGSGKSNLMDAISFVLGLQSNSLRSTNAKDLIYRGRVAGTDNDDDDDDMDNSDKENYSGVGSRNAYVSAIYETSEGEQVQFKRVINSNGSTEYRINEKLVTMSEYSDLLKDENILIKAKNFLVFQGEVEKIAAQSAKELTNIIEIISGSNEYKEEYDYLKEQLDEAHNVTVATFGRRRALKNDFKQYKEQTIEVQRYEDKTKERDQLEITAKMCSMFHNDKNISKLQEQLQAVNQQIGDLSARLEKEESTFEALKTECSEKALNASNDKHKLSKRIEALKDQKLTIIPLDTEKQGIRRQLANLEVRLNEMNADSEKQKSVIKMITKSLNFAQKELKELDEKYVSESITLPEESLKEYNKLRHTFLVKGNLWEAELNEKSQKIDTLSQEFQDLQDKLDAETSKLDNLESLKTSKEKSLHSKTSLLNDQLEFLQTKQASLSSFKSIRQTHLKQVQEVNLKLRDVLSQLDELNASQRESQRERALSDINVSLKRVYGAMVKGSVHSLLKPTHKRYQAAISAALGKDWDSIIVENASAAQQCIQYLKENRSGTATFIPINSVKVSPVSPHLRNIHSEARPLIDVIEYNSSLHNAMAYVCSNTLVCDTLDLAKHLKFDQRVNCKVVALNGAVINKSGLMTGGVNPNDVPRWDKAKALGLTKRKDELLFELEELDKKKPNEFDERALIDEISAIELELRLLRRNRTEAERAIRDVELEIEYQKQKVAEVQSLLEHSELGQLRQSYGEVQSKVTHLQLEIYADFCKRNGLESIQQYENSERHREFTRQKTKLLQQISSLENKLEYEKEKYQNTQNTRQDIEREEDKLKESLEDVSRRHAQLVERLDREDAELEVEKEALEMEFEKLGKELETTKQKGDEVADLRGQYEDLQTHKLHYDEELEKENMKKIQVLKDCKMKSIDIPLLYGDMETLELEDDNEASNSSSILADQFVIDYDGNLDEKYKSGDLDTHLQDLSVQMELLSEEINNLTPNTKSLERLAEAEKALKSCERQFNGAREDEKEILSQFDTVKEKRFRLFDKAFQHISKSIDNIYKELTKSKVSPLGGSAYLTLSQEDEPYLGGINFHSMPPTKRFREMNLLSGGEKSIAALALLFAIHSYKPSPFFVLDEVDAALDNANVNRLANYIVKNASPTFQFIVISLKNSLFEKADALVGIYREQRLNSSKAVTLDLRNFSDKE
ncbi:hypothetical protein LJB42_001365 [Komagataella kurtzmanii]|nr:hypothetical protein LJB42_001365 [Komagataella kurtzmanii]